MGYSHNFKSNVLYGVDDINNIVANFTSSGVSAYSDLNGISAALTNAGVANAKDSCRVISTAEGSLKILPGVAFFEDGSVITVDGEGVVLESKKYVYFKRDSITGDGYPCSSNNAPMNGDIPLAEISGGNLSDKRKIAISKIAGFGSNTYQDVSGYVNGTFSLSKTHPTWNNVQSIPLIREDFNYIVVKIKTGDFVGGYFGTRNGTEFKWSGGGVNSGLTYTQSLLNGQNYGNITSFNEPLLKYSNNNDYVVLSFDISADLLNVFMKSPITRNYSVSGIEAFLC